MVLPWSYKEKLFEMLTLTLYFKVQHIIFYRNLIQRLFTYFLLVNSFLNKHERKIYVILHTKETLTNILSYRFDIYC